MTNKHWTFLSNHTHVMVCIARNPEARVRDIAEAVGITERAVQRIIAELEASDYLSHERLGRRNLYRIDFDRPLRHPLEAGVTLRALLANVVDADVSSPSEGDSAADVPSSVFEG